MSPEPTSVEKVDADQTMTAAEAPPPLPGAALGTKRILSIFVGLVLAVFVSALDETIVATASVKITSDFNAFALYSWIPVSYLVAINSAQPLYGKFSDILGRRPVLVFGLVIFLLGSAGCGWAPNMPFFLAARAVAGIGAGGLVGMAYIIISDLFPIEQCPKYQGFLSGGFALAAVLGPVLGGVFTSEATWRWCFWINLPMVGITLVAVLLLLNLPSRKINSYVNELKRVDVIGAFFLVATIACLVLPLGLGGNFWRWNSPQVIVLFIISALSLAIFLWVQLRVAAEPIIPVRLLKNVGLIAAWFTLFFYGMAFITFLYYVPVWSQVVEGMTPITSGLQLLAILGAIVINGFLYEHFLKLADYLPFPPLRTMLAVGCSIHLLGAILIGSTFTPHLPKGVQVVFLLIYGLGCGMTIQTSFISAVVVVDPMDIAMANSLAVLFQNLGDATGLAISGAILRATLQAGFRKISADVVNPSTLSQILDNPDLINQPGFLPDAARGIVKAQFVKSLQLVFRVTIAFAGVALIVGFFTRPPPKEQKGGSDANGDNEENGGGEANGRTGVEDDVEKNLGSSKRESSGSMDTS
ncbi:hypothetical protein BOTBODRAFT_362312 [Botryobasidium botryosum FD-172 SS1]|uniref:Major facilitator superfamily (MFS) profile domain-containing protein n=1 Tax=Botryobasidium botryosum (strain FD-172 SS1) TaxID=930990 RepID=A0A067MGP8_BOTB1|nr:hypothetical protein BOTBODRAFT_362312 [Botryobasidium botryosum FD-172 SS1]